MTDYPWTQADRTPEIDALAEQEGAARAEREWLAQNMPESLEINGVTYVRSDVAAKPDECQAHECSYYKHYLVWWTPEANGPKLEHEALHEAERRCLEAQEKVIKWMDENESGDVPSSLTRLAEMWEKKVAA
jgi:hypothetical protein